jgi:hypothetical protein
MNFKSIYLARRNPTIAPEDWPKAWRSHPKAVSQMPQAGAAIAAALDSINYCALVRAPTLDGAPFDPPGASRDHDGVAVVASASDALHHIGDVRPADDPVVLDEVRVFGRKVDDFAVKAKEALVLGGRPGQAAVHRLLVRKAGGAPEAFQARLAKTAEVARPAVDAGKVVRYVHNVVVDTPPPGYEFDGVVETWFPTVEDAVRSFVDPATTAIAKDLAEFCDMDRSVTMLTEVIFRHPRE